MYKSSFYIFTPCQDGARGEEIGTATQGEEVVTAACRGEEAGTATQGVEAVTAACQGEDAATSQLGSACLGAC